MVAIITYFSAHFFAFSLGFFLLLLSDLLSVIILAFISIFTPFIHIILSTGMKFLLETYMLSIMPIFQSFSLSKEDLFQRKVPHYRIEQ